MKKDLLNGQKYKPIKLNKPSIIQLKFLILNRSAKMLEYILFKKF